MLAIAKTMAIIEYLIRAAVIRVVALPCPPESVVTVGSIIVIVPRNLPMPISSSAGKILHPPCSRRKVVGIWLVSIGVSCSEPCRLSEGNCVVGTVLSFVSLVVTETILHRVIPEGDRDIAVQDVIRVVTINSDSCINDAPYCDSPG